MGKNKAALFELIRDPAVNQRSMPVAQQTRQVGSPRAQEPEPAAPSIPISVAPRETKPRVVLSTAPKVDIPPEVTPHAAAPKPAAGPRFDPGRKLTVSTSIISVAVAVVILLLVVVAATAYRRGEAKAERAARAELERAGVRDPLRPDTIPLNTTLLTPEPGSQAAAPQVRAPVQPIQQRPVPTPVPAGPLADTREVGLNYAVAASRLDREAAERAATFLRENKVPAIAVLEGGSSGSNNPDSWKVVVLKGITGKQYASRDAVRTEVEAELTRLGDIYRRDPKGRINFGQYAWEKKKD